MSRSALVTDRVAALVAGVLMLGVGALAIVWWSGRWSALPDQIDAGGLLAVLGQPWWPWVAGIAGLALLVLGVWWLAAHLRSQKVGRMALPGSSQEGKLTADARPVAKAAGEVLGTVRGVRSSRASISHDRGQIVARLTATIDPDADLRQVAEAADRVSADLRQVLGREDISCLVQLKVSSRPGSLARVD